MHVGFQPGVEASTLNRFCFSSPVVGKESYTEFIRPFGKSLQNAQPGTEPAQVLQGVCRVSAGNKGEER